MRLKFSGSANQASSYLQAYCLSSDAIGNCVYISNDKVGQFYQVTSVDIDSTDIIESVAIGIIITKRIATECNIQVFGELENVYAGLTTGKVAYVGVDSKPTHTRPVKPISGKRMIQQIGFALSTNILFIKPNQPIRINST